MKKWDVTADGVKHTIEYKRGKVVVDGEVHKVKSSNWFIYMIDYEISFGDAKCNLVTIGNKTDLAVNGTYLGSGQPYKPTANTPAWVWVLVGISTLGGVFMFGLFGCLIGVLMSTLYIKLSLEEKTGAIIGAFIACCVIQIVVGFGLTFLLAGM